MSWAIANPGELASATPKSQGLRDMWFYLHKELNAKFALDILPFTNTATTIRTVTSNDPSFLHVLLADLRLPPWCMGALVERTGGTEATGNPASSASKATTDFYGANTTAEALEFCARNRLVLHLKRAVHLAIHCFPKVTKIDVDLEYDPEDSDEYIVLRVDSDNEPSAVLESYFKYVKDWSSSAGWPASRMIRLDCD